ncbi:MAG: cation:proton antiporter [Parvularculaceae bacterium]
MESLEHLALIWCGVFVAVYLARKTRSTPVLFYLAVGAVYVNTGLLPVESTEFIRGFAEVGILLIMFAIGFEENTSAFVSSVKRTWGIAFFGALAPFCASFTVVKIFWGNTDAALMAGLTMTATAVSLTMVSLKSEGLHKSRAATGIMTSAVLDDIASLALIAILAPIAAGDSAPSMLDISWIVAKAGLFFTLIVILGLWVLPHEMSGLTRWFRISRNWGIRDFFVFDEGKHAVLAALTVAILVGLLAHAFGFHPAVGAYMAGLILKEEYFNLIPDQTAASFEKVKNVIDNVAFSWIGPVFFVELGAKIVFDWDLLVAVIPQTATLLAAMLIAQILSASLAARYTGAFAWHESVMIGFGMLGRAELAFVVLDIAFVQEKIISEEIFYTLMLTAFWLNWTVPVAIAWWKPYYAGKKTLGFLAPPKKAR